MLDRAGGDEAQPHAEDSGARRSAFRGGGFAPADLPLCGLDRARRRDRALATGRQRSSLVNPLFLPTPLVDPARAWFSSRCRARSGSTCRFRSCASAPAGCSARPPASSSALRSGFRALARSVGITFISALFPIPKIALLPLLILWLGIGEEPKIATIALGVFFSTAISVYSGVDAVPRNLIRMAQSFNVPFPPSCAA